VSGLADFVRELGGLEPWPARGQHQRAGDNGTITSSSGTGAITPLQLPAGKADWVRWPERIGRTLSNVAVPMWRHCSLIAGMESKDTVKLIELGARVDRTKETSALVEACNNASSSPNLAYCP
jgi:hypothetical protein